MAVFVSEKIDFKSKTITRDKEGYYIMIKGWSHLENVTITNICNYAILQHYKCSYINRYKHHIIYKANTDKTKGRIERNRFQNFTFNNG